MALRAILTRRHTRVKAHGGEMGTLRASLYAAVIALGLAFGALLVPHASASSLNPGPVTNVQAVVGNGALTMSWTAANPGSSFSGTPYTISRYTVRATSPGITGTVDSCETQSTSCVLTRLTNGVDYFIQVTATNSMFGSSNVWSAGPWRPCCSSPSAPAAVTATAADGTASVSWSPPSNTAQSPGTLSYRVTSEPPAVDCTTGNLTCGFTGLINGTTYTFVVVASNAHGASPGGRSPAVKPKGLPSSPTNVIGYVADRGAVDVTWSGPSSTGGVVISQYIATASPGGATCTSTGELSCQISGLSNGLDYTFNVVAINEVGASAVSLPSPVAKPLAGPGRPLAVRASAGRGTVRVTWKPPASTGGLNITKYVVEASPGGRSCTTKKTTCTIGGLTDNTTYQFSVQAFNSKGAGLPWQSNAVTTSPTPPPPPKPTQEIS